jgi:hypothetical protein
VRSVAISKVSFPSGKVPGSKADFEEVWTRRDTSAPQNKPVYLWHPEFEGVSAVETLEAAIAAGGWVLNWNTGRSADHRRDPSPRVIPEYSRPVPGTDTEEFFTASISSASPSLAGSMRMSCSVVRTPFLIRLSGSRDPRPSDPTLRGPGFLPNAARISSAL